MNLYQFVGTQVNINDVINIRINRTVYFYNDSIDKPLSDK